MSLYQARVIKPGTDATLLAYGPMVRTCVEAAIAAGKEGRNLEVVDLRSLSPLDDATILASVRRTGRAIVVHEAVGTLGMGAEIAARIQAECFYELQAPVLRVTGYDLPYPPSRTEDGYLPDLDRVLDAVDRSLAY
jgi:pyruvate dehydrogenase E1 component beta subunit